MRGLQEKRASHTWNCKGSLWHWSIVNRETRKKDETEWEAGCRSCLLGQCELLGLS